jgi:hypothetical protein
MVTCAPGHLLRLKCTTRFSETGTWPCLCTTFLLLALLITSYQINTQKSNNPATPWIVCNGTGIHTVLHVLSDGGNATWLDDRTDGLAAEIFGQHEVLISMSSTPSLPQCEGQA